MLDNSSLEARIKKLEEENAYYHKALDKLLGMIDVDEQSINMAGNLLATSIRDPQNPNRILLGDSQDSCLYFFWQGDRPTYQGTHKWGGLETYLAPSFDKPRAWGYGALPGRVWFMNLIAEANGNLAFQNAVVGNRIYLSPVRHRNLRNGFFELPHHYDEHGVPYTEGGLMLGGISSEPQDETYVAVEFDAWVFYVKGREVGRIG